MLNIRKNPSSKDTIKSYQEALTYVEEELIISLDWLMCFVGSDFSKEICPQPRGVGIYILDRVKPDYVLTSSDKLFGKKSDGSVVELKIESDDFFIDRTFIQSDYIDIYSKVKGPKRVQDIFGNTASFSRSEVGCMKLIAIHAFYNYLETLGLYDLHLSNQVPSLHSVLPNFTKESWKNYMSYRAMQTFYQTGEYKEPEDEEYAMDFVEQTKTQMNKVVKAVSNFFEYDRDNFYHLELTGDELRLVKGIDHKYLPYYEKKFGL